MFPVPSSVNLPSDRLPLSVGGLPTGACVSVSSHTGASVPGTGLVGGVTGTGTTTDSCGVVGVLRRVAVGRLLSLRCPLTSVQLYTLTCLRHFWTEDGGYRHSGRQERFKDKRRHSGPLLRRECPHNPYNFTVVRKRSPQSREKSL